MGRSYTIVSHPCLRGAYLLVRSYSTILLHARHHFPRCITASTWLPAPHPVLLHPPPYFAQASAEREDVFEFQMRKMEEDLKASQAQQEAQQQEAQWKEAERQEAQRLDALKTRTVQQEAQSTPPLVVERRPSAEGSALAVDVPPPIRAGRGREAAPGGAAAVESSPLPPPRQQTPAPLVEETCVLRNLDTGHRMQLDPREDSTWDVVLSQLTLARLPPPRKTAHPEYVAASPRLRCAEAAKVVVKKAVDLPDIPSTGAVYFPRQWNSAVTADTGCAVPFPKHSPFGGGAGSASVGQRL